MILLAIVGGLSLGMFVEWRVGKRGNGGGSRRGESKGEL
jgi:hypothetical protein